MWTRETAVDFIDYLTPYVKSAGYNIGLAGSLLLKETSSHDLDLILFPHSTTHQDHESLAVSLKAAGLTKKFDRDFVHKQWRKIGSTDEKHVEVWEDSLDRRIDFFLLS